MIQSNVMLEALQSQGYSFFSGVPCSFLKPFINSVINSDQLNYVGASSEGEAIGITLGAYLAGKKTVSMCQNSGLGNMVNPLTSLNAPFRIPTLLVTTWRGEPGLNDEPQHELMGQITHQLLETLKIPWLPFPETESEILKTLKIATDHMDQQLAPFALVLRKGVVAPFSIDVKSSLKTITTHHFGEHFHQPHKRLTRIKAIEIILENGPPTDALIATTGKTGRELFTLNDRLGNFYVVGGMGTAAAIGLGICQTSPKQRVVVLDGDGAALMKLGALATVGHYQPENLLHIILDNEVHDSTGGQATASSTTQFAAIAAGANYQNVYTAETAEQLLDCLTDEKQRRGPSLLHLKIKPGALKKLGRPTIKPHQVKERFMDFLSANALV
jgi:phosphonopyruvate decarboxylase